MSDDRHSNPVSPMDPPTGKGYALSGKIMLSAIVVLFAVVVIMVLLHIYARWYLLRHRSQHRRRRRGSRRPVHHLVFYVDPTNFNSVIDPSPASAAANRRLDPAVLKSLPTFTFSTLKSPADLPTDQDGAEKDEDDAVLPECAVCLSEFENGERGRLLPRCGHSFHVDCIDMWFHSHSTCPLCRSAVAADDPLSPSKIDGDDSGVEIVVNLSDSDTNNTTTHTPHLTTTLPVSTPDSNHCPDSTPATPLVVGGSSSSSSFGGTRKGTTDSSSDGRFSIEIPTRSSSFSFSTSVDELSPASQAYRSPTSRLLSLRRILSREKKPLSSSPVTSPCSSSYNIIGSTGVNLGDIEEGRPFETPKTPR